MKIQNYKTAIVLPQSPALISVRVPKYSPPFIFNATTWKRQLGSDKVEATKWKRQPGSDNLWPLSASVGNTIKLPMSLLTWKMDRFWTVTILMPPTWGFNPEVKLHCKVKARWHSYEIVQNVGNMTVIFLTMMLTHRLIKSPWCSLLIRVFSVSDQGS